MNRPNSLLTLFPDLNAPANGNLLLHKDVGMIPYHLAIDHGWQVALAYIRQTKDGVRDPVFCTG